MFPRVLLTISLLAFTLLGAVPAFAQTAEEKAGARAAAESGGAAFEAGRYEEAIDYFSRAEQIIHALPHLLYMARANEKLGRLVQARELYLKIDQEELPKGTNQFIKDTKKMAAAELEQLEPRMPFISVVVQGAGNEPVRVMRDGTEMPRALVGIPQPMNPGEHSFKADAPGMESSLQKVTIAEGSKETVLLTLRGKGGGAVAAETNDGSPAEPVDASSSSSSTPWMKIGGYTGVGLGVAGLAVGTIFVVMASNTHSASSERFAACNPGCSGAQQSEIGDLDAQANSEVTIGVIGLSAGAVLAATGVTLLVLGDGDDEPTQARIRPWLGFGSVGLSGRF